MKPQFTRKSPPPGFYTYAYLREGDGTPWYIGKGCGDRAWARHGSDKYRWSPPPNERILFLKWGLEEEAAFAHEVYLIGVYGLERDGGILAGNQTYGGEGASGYEQSDELKELQRRIQAQRQLDNPDQHIVEAAERWGFELNEWQRFTKAQRMVIMAGLRRGIDREAVLAGAALGVDLRSVQKAWELGISDLRRWADATQSQRDRAGKRFKAGFRGIDALLSNERLAPRTQASSYKARTEKIADARLRNTAERLGVSFEAWKSLSRRARLCVRKRVNRGWSIEKSLVGLA